MRFCALASRCGLNPDNRWIGGSVRQAWERSRHVYEQLPVPLAGARLLEFGCYVGGTAVVLAAMGAMVTAVDVDPGIVELAATNAARYGVKNIQFHCVPDTTRLPFRDEEFGGDHLQQRAGVRAPPDPFPGEEGDRPDPAAGRRDRRDGHQQPALAAGDPLGAVVHKLHPESPPPDAV